MLSASSVRDGSPEWDARRTATMKSPPFTRVDRGCSSLGLPLLGWRRVGSCISPSWRPSGLPLEGQRFSKRRWSCGRSDRVSGASRAAPAAGPLIADPRIAVPPSPINRFHSRHDGRSGDGLTSISYTRFVAIIRVESPPSSTRKHMVQR